MKKQIFVLALVIIMALSLSSCDLLSIFGGVASEGGVTVVIENTDGTYDVYTAELDAVENKSEGAAGVVEYLSEREENPRYLDMVNSTYGAYVNAIGSIKAEENTYVLIYTSLETDSYEGAPTVLYEGITLYQAGLGLSAMTVNEDSVILFRLETF